jgi:hypothetical protein
MCLSMSIQFRYAWPWRSKQARQPRKLQHGRLHLHRTQIIQFIRHALPWRPRNEAAAKVTTRWAPVAPSTTIFCQNNIISIEKNKNKGLSAMRRQQPTGLMMDSRISEADSHNTDSNNNTSRLALLLPIRRLQRVFLKFSL